MQEKPDQPTFGSLREALRAIGYPHKGFEAKAKQYAAAVQQKLAPNWEQFLVQMITQQQERFTHLMLKKDYVQIEMALLTAILTPKDHQQDVLRIDERLGQIGRIFNEGGMSISDAQGLILEISFLITSQHQSPSGYILSPLLDLTADEVRSLLESKSMRFITNKLRRQVQEKINEAIRFN